MSTEEEIKEMMKILQEEEMQENPTPNGLIKGVINAFIIEGIAIVVVVGVGILLSYL